ncbi:protein MAIN-LIKE 2-like [Dioscorea cayenensis subsp. rotundata]|uniref:Protein MAIN-LIKE 2-like n=1 Tax=Dioscorea cayennensis subsp. rotundata TaxID=55577 RepID=A0AB40B5P8_DIOCR|nr:protein MAIN-LIKE 2-like [Dioscorea cayenensis subsp. rotundata]
MQYDSDELNATGTVTDIATISAAKPFLVVLPDATCPITTVAAMKFFLTFSPDATVTSSPTSPLSLPPTDSRSSAIHPSPHRLSLWRKKARVLDLRATERGEGKGSTQTHHFLRRRKKVKALMLRDGVWSFDLDFVGGGGGYVGDSASGETARSDHISSILSEKPDRVLRCRHVSIAEPPPQIIGLLREAGFYHAAQILNFRIDAALVSALVERWRTETHTFHLTCGETTITLEDVALLLGLPINGHEVIGQTSGLGSAVCAELLGVVPPAEQRKGQSITLTWLEETFGMLSYDAGQRQIECYARAYILRLIGCVLMPDMSQNRVHLKWLPLLRDFTEAGRYSWGSACLATLYRSLCRASNKDMKNISGYMILLQSWSWYRISSISPRTRGIVSFPLARR